MPPCLMPRLFSTLLNISWLRVLNSTLLFSGSTFAPLRKWEKWKQQKSSTAVQLRQCNTPNSGAARSWRLIYSSLILSSCADMDGRQKLKSGTFARRPARSRSKRICRDCDIDLPCFLRELFLGAMERRRGKKRHRHLQARRLPNRLGFLQSILLKCLGKRA